MPSTAPKQGAMSLPTIYRVFFLLIEPVSALAGAWFAHRRQAEYLLMTANIHVIGSPGVSSHDHSVTGLVPGLQGSVPLATSVALSQLANMYLLFAAAETLVLRSTSDIKAWRALLTAFLIADMGHLYAVGCGGFAAAAAGQDSLSWTRVYWDVTAWNAMDWGNVPFVYLGASMRVAFLAGVGFGPAKTNTATTTAPRKIK